MTSEVPFDTIRVRASSATSLLWRKQKKWLTVRGEDRRETEDLFLPVMKGFDELASSSFVLDNFTVRFQHDLLKRSAWIFKQRSFCLRAKLSNQPTKWLFKQLK